MGLLELPNHNLLPKVPKSYAKREPKLCEKLVKWMLLDLSKHMVFTVQNTHWAVSGELWEHILSTLLSGHSFVVICVDFWDLGCQKGPQNVGVFFPRTHENWTPSPKSSPRGPEPCPWAEKGAQRSQNVTKSYPKVTILVPKSHRNGPRVLLFQITYKQRNDCTKILEY